MGLGVDGRGRPQGVCVNRALDGLERFGAMDSAYAQLTAAHRALEAVGLPDSIADVLEQAEADIEGWISAQFSSPDGTDFRGPNHKDVG